MGQLPNNNYDILNLPIEYNKSFLDFSGEEIQNYYQWFLRIKNERVTHLCNFLFSDTANCFNEKKLSVIEIFLMNSVAVIPKSKKQFNVELNRTPDRLKEYANPDDYLLDNRTISICYDIGIYLGELIISLDNRIKWGLEVNDEYADFGQPILAKRGCKLRLNPFRATKNVAARMYEGNLKDGQIVGIFNAWKKGYGVGGGSVPN